MTKRTRNFLRTTNKLHPALEALENLERFEPDIEYSPCYCEGTCYDHGDATMISTRTIDRRKNIINGDGTYLRRVDVERFVKSLFGLTP
jgi:hypothetical protein